MSVDVEMAMTYSFCNPDFCRLVFPAEAGLWRAEGLGPRMSGPLPWGLALNCLLHLMGQPCPCVRTSTFPSSLFFILSLSLSFSLCLCSFFLQMFCSTLGSSLQSWSYGEMVIGIIVLKETNR